MRRRLYLIMLLAAITLSGMAQNVGDALYVFRNDGEFHAFLSDEIETPSKTENLSCGSPVFSLSSRIVIKPSFVAMPLCHMIA